MAQLRQDYDLFIKRETEVVVVGPEGPREFEEYWANNQLPYIGLADPQHTVLKRYGQQISLFKLGRMPAQVIVDKSGIARYIHYGNSMSDIPSNRELLRLIDELNREVAFTDQVS